MLEDSIGLPSVMADPAIVRLLESDARNALLARTDATTHLYNKLAWNERLAEKVLSRHPLALIIIDLDKFKEINDTYGHSAGDKCLIDSAKILLNSVRPDDFVARIGGDEFGIIADTYNQEPEEVVKIIKERILKNFQNYNETAKHPILTSIGYGISKETPHDVNKTFDCADKNMYQMKKEHHQALAP